MKAILFCGLTALSLFQAQLSAKTIFQEKFFIPLPHILSQWKVGYQQTEKNGTAITHYIMEQETMENWTELVNVQFKQKKSISSYSDVLEAMREEAANNRYVTFKVHCHDANDLTFEKIFPTGMHELVRMIMTDKGLHRIGYVKRDGPFTELDRSQWMSRLAQGTVGKSK